MNALGAPGSQLFIMEPEEDGSLWVRGRDYKAHVAPEGLVFIPFLGSDAPRNYPSRLFVGEVLVDGRALALPAATCVERDGSRLSLRRGALTVHYDLLFTGIEQSFEVDVRGLVGDVDVRVDVASDLVGGESVDGFSWTGPRGGFRYGRSTALTPSGESLGLASALTVERANPTKQGERLQSMSCRVPADFVARCDGRVLIDPLISAYGFHENGGGYGALVNPDVAFDLRTFSFLHVFQEEFSSGDADVWWVQRHTSGQVMARGAFDLSQARYIDPKVASANAGDKALIVALEETQAFATGRLMGRRFSFVPRTASSLFAIALPNATGAVGRADVGGNQTASGSGQIGVVYERKSSSGSNVEFRAVGASAGLGAVQELSALPTRDAKGPAISKSNGRGAGVNLWTIVWAERDLQSGQNSVQVAQIRPNSTVVVPPTTFITHPSNVEIQGLDVSDALELDEIRPTYMVSYFVDQPGSDPAGKHRLAMGKGGDWKYGLDGHVQEHADVERYRAAAQLSSMDDKFLVLYCEQADGLDANTRAYVTTYNPVDSDRLGINERRLALDEVFAGPNWNGQTAIASRWSGGMNSRYASITLQVGQGSESRIRGFVLDAKRPPTQSIQYCYGLPNSTGERGFLRTEGAADPYSFKTLLGTGLPVGESVYWFMSLNSHSGNQIAQNGGILCLDGQLQVIFGYPTQVSYAGTSSAEVRVDNTLLPGNTVYFTLYHTDIVDGVKGSNFTNAVAMPIR